jgi:hypothetical protein
VQSLFKSFAQCLGFEYKQTDSPADTQLRTVAIALAAAAQDEVVRTLLTYLETYIGGDENTIAADLLSCAFMMV